MADGQFNRAAAKAAGYSDAEIDAYLSRTQPRTPERPVAQVPMGAPAESTRAPRGMTRVQQAQSAQQRAERRERFREELGMIPAAIANVSRDIPGAEAAQAFARSIARGQTYREALGDIRGATGALPTAVALPTRIAGGALAGAVMPGTVARQAATYGAAHGALEASPDVGMGERAFRTAGGAVLGGALAKGTQAVGTAVRASRGASRAQRELAEEARRNAVASPLYEEFRALGNIEPTERLQQILDLPIVRRAVRTIRAESPDLRDVPVNNAEMLDEVYKRIGNKAFTAQQGFQTDRARQELLDAIDEASGGLYRPAVAAFREGSENLEASLRGARAIQRGTSPSSGATLAASLEDSPEALLQWARTATPRQREMAVGGVLGEAKQHGFADLFSPMGFRGTNVSLFPGARRAMTAAEIIEALERTSTRPSRRIARMAAPTFLNPSENDIPRSR